MKKVHNQTDREIRPSVTPREFVQIWQSSNSVAEVSSKIHCTKNAVRVRACRYRQMGVPLKQFPVMEIEPINWDELAVYAESFDSGQIETIVSNIAAV